MEKCFWFINQKDIGVASNDFSDYANERFDAIAGIFYGECFCVKFDCLVMDSSFL